MSRPADGSDEMKAHEARVVDLRSKNPNILFVIDRSKNLVLSLIARVSQRDVTVCVLVNFRIQFFTKQL